MSKLAFNEIKLSNGIQRGISEMGFEEMSPIQEQAIPVILAGRDVIGQAQTGTGKTAAFGIPILETCDPSDKRLQALVLCPTRELSIQVAEEIRNIGKFMSGIKVLPIYGGQPIDRQIRSLKGGVQIVVGTPGRVMDHMRRRTLKLDKVKMMVLDEADEMFDMGFRDDIGFVMDELPEERQTVFFSATMPKEIINFASKYQNNPELVKVVHKELTLPKIEQYYFELKEHMKTEILSRLIDINNPKLSIVFCNTKKRVDELTEKLTGRGYLADGLHGDLKQSQRDTVMNKFRNGTIDILIATDVAARGLDVDDIDLVVNYDIPRDEEYYVHRIGRTARAGREGVAYSFVVGRDKNLLANIQRYANTKIKRRDIPTLKDMEQNYRTSALDKIKDEITKGELGKYSKIVDALIEEGFTSFDIAAALLKFYMDDSKYEKHEKLEQVDFGGKFRSSGGKNERLSKDTTRLFINIGSRKGASQRHILAALVQDANLQKNHVGAIDIYDKFSFVEIPANLANDVVRNLNNKRIRGSMVQVEIATPKRKSGPKRK